MLDILTIVVLGAGAGLIGAFAIEWALGERCPCPMCRRNWRF